MIKKGHLKNVQRELTLGKQQIMSFKDKDNSVIEWKDEIVKSCRILQRIILFKYHSSTSQYVNRWQ